MSVLMNFEKLCEARSKEGVFQVSQPGCDCTSTLGRTRVAPGPVADLSIKTDGNGETKVVWITSKSLKRIEIIDFADLL